MASTTSLPHLLEKKYRLETPRQSMREHLFSELRQRASEERSRRRREHQRYNWMSCARENQLPPPGDWRSWLILAGRGFGKTRTGAETIRTWVQSGRFRRIALVGQSLADVRSVMVEGESGLMAIHPPGERPDFQATQRRLVWPNGAIAQLFSAANYEQLRGPQFDAAWIDELAKFRYAQETWDQLMFGLRLGRDPRCLITTTPRPIPLLEKLMAASDTAVTRGSTYDNQENLAPAFLSQIIQQFEGTALGSQELWAEMLTERQGALWQRSMIQYGSPGEMVQGVYPLERLVIAIDPATTHHEGSDETGIVIVGRSSSGQVYVLEDHSGRRSPTQWGEMVIEAYWRLKADCIVAEVNKGGDLVERVLKTLDPHIAFKAVRATRGKATRAEPIAALYEQKKVYHHRPLLLLEKQLCEYIPGITKKSPDRLDALVWGITDLMLEAESRPQLRIWSS